MSPKIGVLSLQGDFAEHIAVLKSLKVEPQEVRLPRDMDGLHGLIIPGGESTTFAHLMDIYCLREPISKRVSEGMAIWGTCAGMIMMASNISEPRPVPMRLLDIDVTRNFYGRQVDSFETDLVVEVLSDEPFHAIFIRAPAISRVGSRVKVLASLDGAGPVAVQQGQLLATSFHPELTGDSRFHRYFLGLAEKVNFSND